MAKLFRGLGYSRRAITSVEFAFLSPVMMLMLCGTVELGNMVFARIVLEGSVVEAARLATASIEDSESARQTKMSASIRRSMGNFPLARGQAISIQTVVYANFSSAYPETYDDSNRNGRYDVGETYVDRNKNGRWDAATPKAGTMGGAGDVIAITVRYPKRVLFSYVGKMLGLGNAVNLSASTVVRNEAVTKTS